MLSKISYLTFEGEKQHGIETSERTEPAIWGSFTFKINIVCLLKQVTIHLPSYAQIFFSLFQDFFILVRNYLCA